MQKMAIGTALAGLMLIACSQEVVTSERNKPADTTVSIEEIDGETYTNYCHDAESNAEWDSLGGKGQKDDAIHVLHALRLGLCQKIDEGSISFLKGVDLFEQFRKMAIDSARAMEPPKTPAI